MSEAVDGTNSGEESSAVDKVIMDFRKELVFRLAEEFAIEKLRREAETEFCMDIITRDLQRWADIFLEGKAVIDIDKKDIGIIFDKVMPLFKDCILGDDSRFITVSKEQVGMPLIELAAKDPAVRAGWMQPLDQNPDARAGYGVDGELPEDGCVNVETLIRTEEALRLLEEWNGRFGEPLKNQHQLIRATSDLAQHRIDEALFETLAAPIGIAAESTAQTGD